jgi:putative FmdB family regulatory protein
VGPIRLRQYHRHVPIYEFECGGCGERFDRLVDAGTESADCPKCETAGAERRLSAFRLSSQPTANQRRRMEDKRGTNRDGARQRFKSSLAKARERKPGR